MHRVGSLSAYAGPTAALTPSSDNVQRRCGRAVWKQSKRNDGVSTANHGKFRNRTYIVRGITVRRDLPVNALFSTQW